MGDKLNIPNIIETEDTRGKKVILLEILLWERGKSCARCKVKNIETDQVFTTILMREQIEDAQMQ